MKVYDTPQPMVFEIQKKVPTPPLKGRGAPPVACKYWDDQTNTFISEGCSFVGETLTSVKCSCTHMTEFSAGVNVAQLASVPSASDLNTAKVSGDSLI